jgi:hypothetical protein
MLVGLVGLVIGLASLVEPLAALRIQNRKQAVGVIGISIVLMTLGGTVF